MKTLMEQEINEVGQVLGNLISKYIVNYCITVNFPSKFSRIKFIASGSSHNCAGIAEKFFRDIAILKTLWIFNKTLLKEGMNVKILCTFTIIYT